MPSFVGFPCPCVLDRRSSQGTHQLAKPRIHSSCPADEDVRSKHEPAEATAFKSNCRQRGGQSGATTIPKRAATSAFRHIHSQSAGHRVRISHVGLNRSIQSASAVVRWTTFRTSLKRERLISGGP